MSNDDPAFDVRRRHFAVEVHRDVRIPTPDPEVSLSADVFRPTTADPVPTLITAAPYRKDYAAGGRNAALARWFAERGYAHLLVDLRGIGSSDGAPRQKNDPAEADDAIVAIEWAAVQPWCTGNIGMWGASAPGITTLHVASHRPPQLKAIIAMICPLDPGREAIHHDGARVDLHQRAWWSGGMLLEQLLPPLLNYSSAEEQRRWRRRLHHTEPFLLDLARSPEDPVWRERAIDATSITVPTLCVGGWRDPYAAAMTRLYERVRGPKKLLVGPWAHSQPQDSPHEPIDFPAIALRWWDHWLCDIDDGLLNEPPVTIYVQGDNPSWRSYDSWPPAPAEALELATGSDTTLTATAPVEIEGNTAIAVYRPDPTTGALSGLSGLPDPGFGRPLDQHDDDMRALTATSEPLPDDIVICGRPHVRIRLTAENAEPHRSVRRLVVRLADVDPFGRSTFVTAGVVCPGAPSEKYEIELRPTAYRVKRGHRLRVVLSDSDFPRLVPLTDPTPVYVAAIELTAPTVSDDYAASTDLPIIDAPSRTLEGRWTITRDPIHDGIEVRFGFGARGVRTSEGHVIDRNMDTRATVRRSAPEAAVTTGDHKAEIRMVTGENIVAMATVRCTQTALWARGELTIDGVSLFSRIWEIPLEHEHQ